MRKIYKYTIECSPKILEIPKGGRVVHVSTQFETLRIWVLVDPDAPLESRRFERALTGGGFDDELLYVGTATMEWSDGGTHVVHILERIVPPVAITVFPPVKKTHFFQNPVIRPAEEAWSPPTEGINALLHLFWKYLDGGQRTHALMNSKIVGECRFPLTIPQTMEGSLVRGAGRERLELLWDQVVALVPKNPTPSAASGPNPFKKLAA